MPIQVSGVLPLLKAGFQRCRAGRGVGFEHPHRRHGADVGGRQPPDDVGAGIILLGDQLGRDDVPVESRTQAISIVGLSASNAFLKGSSWSFSRAV